MLDLSASTHYVHEPFAPMNPRSWLSRRPEERFLHQSPDATSPYEEDLDRIVALRPPPMTLLRRARDGRDVIRAGEQVLTAARDRRLGARAIIKDPFALFLAEWIHARSDADVVVCVRHPAAFVSSIVRLGWRLDERWLLAQGELMEGELAAWAPELEQAHDLDLIDHACLVWRVFNSVALRLERDHPTWTVTRYEDLALDPVPSFRTLYERLELPWSDAVGEQVRDLNSSEHPAESERVAVVVRDSRSAVWTWRQRLTSGEIERVRVSTSDVAERWYDDAQWW